MFELPRHRKIWADEEGKAYRQGVYDRQKKDGTKPLISNPTIEEIKATIKKYHPYSVFEVGCGWGRILDELRKDFTLVAGCDISQEYLDVLKKNGYEHIELADITEKGLGVRQHVDIVFTRGVLMYFYENRELLGCALENMFRLARSKIILWEYPEVLETVVDYTGSDKFFFASRFELFPIKRLEE